MDLWVWILIIVITILVIIWVLVSNKEVEPKQQKTDIHEPAAAATGTEIESAEAVIAEEMHIETDQPAAEAQIIPDDLKKIEGIGPKIASLLQEKGILTFAHLAEMDEDRLVQILTEASLQHIARPATWPEQAKLAANGEWDALAALQDSLKGGQRT